MQQNSGAKGQTFTILRTFADKVVALKVDKVRGLSYTLAHRIQNSETWFEERGLMKKKSKTVVRFFSDTTTAYGN